MDGGGVLAEMEDHDFGGGGDVDDFDHDDNDDALDDASGADLFGTSRFGPAAGVGPTESLTGAGGGMDWLTSGAAQQVGVFRPHVGQKPSQPQD
jgi:hypothetical protein